MVNYTGIRWGGGGFQQDGTGQAASVSISSTTTTHEQFFLRNKSGKEKSFEFSNADLAIREGGIVTVLWAIKHGKETGRCFAVYNHDTEELIIIKSEINKLYSIKQRVIGIVVIISTIISAWFGVPLLLGTIFGNLSGISNVILIILIFLVSISVSVFGIIHSKKTAKQLRMLLTSKVKNIVTKINETQASDTPASDTDHSNQVVCRNCSAQTSKTANFCENCGTSVSTA